MKNVRIYKDDIRVHMLRSLFFTDTVLVGVSSLIIASILYLIFHYVLHVFNWGYFISSLVVTVIFFVTFITQRIDNQPIYKIARRASMFKTTKKQQRYRDLEPYFVDFTIQDNHIIRKGSIVRMYEVEPFDIALLNDQDREHFFVKLKQAIHTLPSQVQFIVRKGKATSSDYSRHFFSLYDSSNEKREPLISRYVEDMKRLLDEETFLVTRHYAVFSVACTTTKPNEKIEAMKKLNDTGLRFAASLSQCNISARPLESEQLMEFAKLTLR